MVSKMSFLLFVFVFFFNDTATTEIYTLSLHDALPIARRARTHMPRSVACACPGCSRRANSACARGGRRTTAGATDRSRRTACALRCARTPLPRRARAARAREPEGRRAASLEQVPEVGAQTRARERCLVDRQQ